MRGGGLGEVVSIHSRSLPSYTTKNSSSGSETPTRDSTESEGSVGSRSNREVSVDWETPESPGTEVQWRNEREGEFQEKNFMVVHSKVTTKNPTLVRRDVHVTPGWYTPVLSLSPSGTCVVPVGIETDGGR